MPTVGHMFAIDHEPESSPLGTARRTPWTAELRLLARSIKPEPATLTVQTPRGTWTDAVGSVRVLVEASEYDRPGAKLVVALVAGEDEPRVIAASRLQRGKR